MLEPTRVYVDMVGDLFHGHVALLRAVRGFGDQLVVGCCPTRPSQRTNEVIPDSPYRVTQELLDEHDLALVVHGDDVGAGGFEDVYGPVLGAGLIRLVPRTGDISTTALIA